MKRNCWECEALKATVGGWHCLLHNVFLHEQVKEDDVGHGGDGCTTKYPPAPVRKININVRFEL